MVRILCLALVFWGSFIADVSTVSAADPGATVDKGAIEEVLRQHSTFNVTERLSVGSEGKLVLSSDNPADGNVNLLDRVIRLIAGLLGTFGIIMFIIGGYFLITSAGDENQLQKGKTILIYTLIGIAMAFLSYTIVQFVISLVFKAA